MKTIRKHLGLLALAIAATIYGGSKAAQAWRFRFEAGLYDTGSSSVGNIVTVRWGYSTDIKFDIFRWAWRIARIADATGAEAPGEWHQLPDALVIDRTATAVIEPDEGGIEIVCWAVHTVGPTVTTNGVYHLSNVMHPLDGDPEKWLTPTIPIKADDRYLSGNPPPPPEPINIPEELINQFLEENE